MTVSKIYQETSLRISKVVHKTDAGSFIEESPHSKFAQLQSA